METTIVQPGASPSIYTTGDHHGHHGHDGGGHRFDAVESRADYRALTAEIERFGTINGDRTMSGVQVTGDRITAVGSAAALAAGRTNEPVQAAACRTDSLDQAALGATSD